MYRRRGYPRIDLWIRICKFLLVFWSFENWLETEILLFGDPLQSMAFTGTRLGWVTKAWQQRTRKTTAPTDQQGNYSWARWLQIKPLVPLPGADWRPRVPGALENPEGACWRTPETQEIKKRKTEEQQESNRSQGSTQVLYSIALNEARTAGENS